MEERFHEIIQIPRGDNFTLDRRFLEEVRTEREGASLQESLRDRACISYEL